MNTGISFATPARFHDKTGFLVEPTSQLLLADYVPYNLENARFVQMMHKYVTSPSLVTKQIAASCICSFSTFDSKSMTDHPLFQGLKGTVYDMYSVNFAQHAIMYDHGGEKALSSLWRTYQFPSVVLNYLLNNEEKNEALTQQLARVILISDKKNQAELIAFAVKCKDKCKDESLPDIIPVIVSVHKSTDKDVCTRLRNDLQSTKIGNMYPAQIADQNSNTAQDLDRLHNVVKIVEDTNTYVRVLFHPWLNTSNQTSLEGLLQEEANTSSFYDNGFAAVSNNSGIIQVAQNSPAFTRIKQALLQSPDALRLFDGLLQQ